jgi:hypothetical protein
MAQDQPGEGKGKITIPWKWRDEEGELDLSDPNDLEKAKRLVNQGYGYEKGQQELKAVKSDYTKAKEQIDYWNGLIEDAKDSGDTSRVLAALEMSGIKVGKIDADDDEAVLDAGDKKFKELEQKYTKLEAALYNKYTADTHSQLEAKYKDEKYPEYNRKEVEDFANKKGIRDFEDAYFIMNKEEILKAQAKEDKDKSKKHSEKINKVASIEPGAGTLPAKPVEKHTDYAKATDGWLSDPTVTENLFDEE